MEDGVHEGGEGCHSVGRCSSSNLIVEVSLLGVIGRYLGVISLRFHAESDGRLTSLCYLLGDNLLCNGILCDQDAVASCRN